MEGWIKISLTSCVFKLVILGYGAGLLMVHLRAIRKSAGSGSSFQCACCGVSKYPLCRGDGWQVQSAILAKHDGWDWQRTYYCWNVPASLDLLCRFWHPICAAGQALGRAMGTGAGCKCSYPCAWTRIWPKSFRVILYQGNREAQKLDSR